MSGGTNSVNATIRLLLFSIFASLSIYLFAVFHPFSQPVYITAPLPLAAVHAWLILQAFGLCAPGLILGAVSSHWFPRMGLWLGDATIALGSALFFIDVFTFNFIGERLFSQTSRRILLDLAPGILANLNSRMVVTTLSVALGFCAIWITASFSAKRIANHILQDRRSSSAWEVGLIGAMAITGAAAMPLWRMDETLVWMRENSDRQPVFATGLIRHRDQGISAPIGLDRLRSATRALAIAPKIEIMKQRYSRLEVAEASGESPDILLVVIESLRPEAISPQTSPNLYNHAQQGIWCRNHYSTCNSTNMAMFSMFFGLESVWFETARDWEPAILKLAKSAGYRTGFFGGSKGWDLFSMESFVHPQRFDVYCDSEVDWLESDAEMCRLANEFLDAPADKSPSPQPRRQPRLCVLYLYSTHFDYRSAPEDRVHHPALEGELTGVYATADRDRVWNRYLNSVHSIDRLLKPLLTTDRIVIVAGDHGEAFLEDGCRLHGVRLSWYQNATPAILTGPGIPKKSIDYITTHTDLLPTMLDAANIEVSDPNLLEGRSLLELKQSEQRLMVTRNYVRPELMILHDKRSPPHDMLGYRCFFSMTNWEAYAANPIDHEGFAWQNDRISEQAAEGLAESAFSNWLKLRFGDDAAIIPKRPAKSLMPHLKSADLTTMVFALRLAAGVEDNEIGELLPVVAEACQHSDEGVRQTARSTLIVLQRRLK